MSGLPRSSRIRLKHSLESSPPVGEDEPLLSSSSILEANKTISPKRLGTPEQRINPPFLFSNETVGIMDVQHMDDEEIEDIQDDANTPAANNSLLSNNLAALSDDSSSDLSEVDDGASYNDENGVGSVGRSSSHDIDSEAETERLEISPQKAREQPTLAGVDQISNSGSELRSTLVLTKPLGSDKVNENGATKEDTIILNRAYSRSPENRFGNGRILSPPDVAGHKRKRSGSIVGDVSDSGGNEAISKRSISLRREEIYIEHEKTVGTSDAGAADDEGSDALSDVTSASDLTAVPGETMVYTNGAIIERSSPMKDVASPSSEDEVMSDREIIDLPQEEAPSLSIVKPEDELEVDEAGDLEADEEEAETAVKSEDEMAKKKSAIDALVPIEKLFAIFRDRLFDQRLADLSTELDLLSDPNSTHPDYLAMRQCIDERREQKIQLENMLLFYRQKNLESTVSASRAQLHSQYFQTVRDIRERHTEVLNAMFCATQKERRQMQTREPEFGYIFNPKRSQQIIQQMSYNKEVSLLSGLARFVGFPSAPEIQGARRSEMDDDFRAMQIKMPGVAKPTFATISATTKVSDAAAEEHFFEKNPWAANPQLHSAQSMLIDRASPRIPVAISTPITLSRNVSANNTVNTTNATTWMTPEIHNNSTLATPTDQQINHGSGPYRAGGAASNGNNTSPFDTHHPRRTATGDLRSGPSQAAPSNSASTTATPVTTAAAVASSTTTTTTAAAATPTTTSSAPTTTPATAATTTTRFERPYKPKNIPPPSSSIYTPSPRTGMPTFMRTAQSNIGGGSTGDATSTSTKINNNKNDVAGPPRFERITGFTAVNGGGSGGGSAGANTSSSSSTSGPGAASTLGSGAGPGANTASSGIGIGSSSISTSGPSVVSKANAGAGVGTANGALGAGRDTTAGGAVVGAGGGGGGGGVVQRGLGIGIGNRDF